jgi:hypothetical protein
MSQSKVEGIVHLIEETKEVGQRGFRKRLVVLEQPGERFTNYIPIEFIQDGCDTVDDLSEGDKVEITYKLSGRKWQRDAKSEVKYFLSAEGQRFKVLSGGNAAGSDSAEDANAAFDEAADDVDDVPF